MTVESEIKMDNEFIYYALRDCAFCTMAQDVLEKNNISYSVVFFDDNASLLNSIKSAYSWNTVPIVFKNMNNYDYKLIGGYTELLEEIEMRDVNGKS